MSSIIFRISENVFLDVHTVKAFLRLLLPSAFTRSVFCIPLPVFPSCCRCRWSWPSPSQSPRRISVMQCCVMVCGCVGASPSSAASMDCPLLFPLEGTPSFLDGDCYSRRVEGVGREIPVAFRHGYLTIPCRICQQLFFVFSFIVCSHICSHTFPALCHISVL